MSAEAALSARSPPSWHVTGTPSTTRSPSTARRCWAADRKRLTKTRAIGLDDTSFVRQDAHAPAVAGVEHPQIIDILPSRNYRDVAAFLDKQADDWKARIALKLTEM